MKEVNLSHIDALLSPLAGLADDDEAVTKYMAINQNDASEVKTVIRSTIRPCFDRYDMKSMNIAKDSLSYYLSHPGSDFKRLFYSNLLPFDAPDDPKNFFIWLWEELFQGEDYQIENLAEFQVNNSISMPSRNQHIADGFWIKITNEKSVAMHLLIEPWGVGCDMLPNSTFYIYVNTGDYPPEVIYQDAFVIVHQALALLDSRGGKLYDFSVGSLAVPRLN